MGAIPLSIYALPFLEKKPVAKYLGEETGGEEAAASGLLYRQEGSLNGYIKDLYPYNNKK